MKVLITGANGQLGTELRRCFARGCTELGPLPEKLRHASVVETDVGVPGMESLDITDRHAVAAFVRRHAPDVIFSCAAYTNVDGLMQVNDDGYYYYDSTRNFASYDSTTNSMKLYDKPAAKHVNNTGQFFPFNSGSQVFDVDEENNSLRAKNVNAGSSNVNHWFGVSMSTHFMQPVDGKTTTNEDITYEFSGVTWAESTMLPA